MATEVATQSQKALDHPIEVTFEDGVASREADSARTSATDLVAPEENGEGDSGENEKEEEKENEKEQDVGSEEEWDTDLEIDEKKEDYDVTGRKVYLEQCSLLGIVPASYFLQRMQNTEIDMKHRGLGPKGAKALSVALVSNTSVLKLNLSDNWLDAEGGMAVSNMLKENCYVSHLDVSFDKLGLGGGIAMAETLQNNMNITYCNLAGNELSDKTAEPFAEAIKVNYKIRELNLSHNKLGEPAGLVLGPAIGENESLHHLDLSWNYFRRKGAVAIALGLKNNQVLRSLNLAYNGFGNEGALAAGEALKVNTTLTELDLRNNRISADGALLLAKALEVNETLKILKLGQNPLESNGMMAILRAVQKNPNCSLEELGFTDITISEDVAKMIEELKESRPGLRIVHGGLGGLSKAKPREDPMIVLKHYIEERNLRLVDFFNQVDKDKSLSVSPGEFRTGLKKANVPLKDWEISQLISMLDKDNDGEIDFSELVEGAHYATEELREQKRMEETAEKAKQRVLASSSSTFVASK